MPDNEKARIDSLLDAMPLERQVGQLLMVGFTGLEAPDSLLQRIRSGEAGNIILFSRNVQSPDQLRRLVRQLQRAAVGSAGEGVLDAARGAGDEAAVEVGLLVATDQEGGRVVRLKPPATWFPSAMALGAVGDPELTERLAAAMGAQLRALGINMDLAPVLDVNNSPANPVIGLRSFGEDPALVGALGTAFIRGLRSARVAATAKHFPGHGDTDIDSHLDLPVIPHNRARLDRIELAPFRAAIAAGVDAIMTAHVVFPAVEPEAGRSATHSAAVLQGLLRGELGFDGVIVTDCLEMRAISDRFGPGEAALRSFEAGADLILVSHTEARQRAAYQALMEAVRSRRVSEERVRASVRRILVLKERLGLLGAGGGEERARKAGGGKGVVETLVPDVPFAEAVDVAAAGKLAREAATRAVTVVRSGPGEVWSLPALLARGYRGVVVVELGEGLATIAEERGAAALHLAQALQAGRPVQAAQDGQPAQATQAAPAAPGVARDHGVQGVAPSEIRIPAGVRPGGDPSLSERLRTALRTERLLPIVVTRSASRHPDQLEWTEQAVALAPDAAVVVAMGTPYDLAALGRKPALFLAAYGDQPPHVEAVAAVLTGKATGTGRFPVTVG